MKTAMSHIRANAVAYLALFVALGGTGYAAVSIPAGSVGTRQLRNGAVTSAKLDKRSIAGYVAFWARIDSSGHVDESSEPAVTGGWAPGGDVGTIQFHGNLPRDCFALADVTSGNIGAEGAVTAINGGSSGGGQTLLQIFMRKLTGQGAPLPIVVADICP